MMRSFDPRRADRRSRGHRAAAVAGLALLVGGGTAAQESDVTRASRAETRPPFGGEENVAYADAAWTAMADADLVGDDGIVAYPYEGNDPHGTVLEYLETEIPIADAQRLVVVKRNHVGEDVSVENVINDPNEYLASVTVMIRREEGYDPDHQNWWWAKYDPDGSLQTNPADMALAGRVAKGADQGCIACHQTAPGNDYVFSHDRFGG
jgi:hypothetical protein